MADDFTSALPPPPAALAAWLGQSRDLLALSDGNGRIVWANPAFEREAGLGVGGDLLELAPPDWQLGTPRAAIDAAVRDATLGSGDLCLRRVSGDALWVEARVDAAGTDRAWTFRDLTAQRRSTAETQRLSERLEVAQSFGRIGIWERDIASGRGHWDRHMFALWGLEPQADAPLRSQVMQHTVPDDERASLYDTSMRKAGLYDRRYRVLQPDGSTRWLHSQWAVKNSAEGTPERSVGVVIDDTEAYRLARELDVATAHLTLAVDLAGLVIWRHDLTTDRVHYNQRGCDLVGGRFRPEGMSPAEVSRHIHPDDVALMVDSARAALAGTQPIDVETRFRRTDGSWRYMLTRRAVERGAGGRATGFVGVSLDVTERVEQTRHARELAQRLAIATRSAHVGIWTMTVGSGETEWDAQMYELFDLPDSAGPPALADVIATVVHPDDADRMTRAISGHRPRRDGAFEEEFRIRRRDGRTRWIAMRADIDHSIADRPRAFGIAMDVTDRRAASAALHAAHERSALIARHAGIGTWETDDEGLPALWDEQMFRLRGLEPRSTSLNRDERLALVHPDDMDQVLDTHPELNGGPLPTAYEFRVRWPDGSYRWIASRSAPLFDAEGKVVRRVGVNWDITDHKNAELGRQQVLLAERESRAKSQFLSRMSHELRTPLNAVLGFTQLLQLDARQRPDGGQLAKLNHIRAAGEHLLTLINDTLDLSSLEAGTLRLDLQPVSVALAVARALPLVEASATARGIAISTGRLEGVAQADPTRLHQVLLNLLSNAVKYNRDGGVIVVDALVAGPHARLSVRDTGRGMQQEQIDHLFEPFNRLGLEGQGIEGTGIGMTIARALVEGMGGRIGVSSAVGIGTVFDVHLPTARPDASDSVWLNEFREQTTLSDAAALPATGLRSGQLLYIEDNPVNVVLVEELVARLHGLRMASEGSAATGVARARSLLPDLILVDMQLPDGDGFEVLRQLRSHPETASIPCIALSANAMPADIARGMAGGFDAYWTKPIRFNEFIAALEQRFPAQP